MKFLKFRLPSNTLSIILFSQEEITYGLEAKLTIFTFEDGTLAHLMSDALSLDIHQVRHLMKHGPYHHF